MTLFRSLVMPLFDYCVTICNPHQLGLIDGLESCVIHLLKAINLGMVPDASTDERYCHHLREIGWEPLNLRRIKLPFLFTYKLIHKLMPFGECLFQPKIPHTAAVVSNSSRSASNLLAYPRLIQPPREEPSRLSFDWLANRSFDLL